MTNVFAILYTFRKSHKMSENIYIYNYENAHSLSSLVLRFLSTSALNDSWTMVGIDKAIIL